jgi:molybdopterin synthase catalytic subunit
MRNSETNSPPSAAPSPLRLGPFEITTAPLNVDDLVAAVQTPADGAVVTFVGIVRDNQDAQRVVALEYEAYAEMATAELQALGEAIAGQFGLHGIAIRHRIGKLAVGETSVVIAVASAHRAAAFAACAEALERLKKTVPIWKKEYYEDGATWLGQGGG